jgi:ABC-type nitrate/sulfonate/bicarbonate transport system substrate-binding protein
LTLLAAAACGSSSDDSASGSGSAQQLTQVNFVIPSKTANQAVSYIADGAGIFKKNGLDVRTTVAGSGALAVAALVSGSADFVITGGSNIFDAQEKGQHLQLLAKALSGLASQLVLTPDAVQRTGVSPDAPVADRVKALDGLTIASASAASSWTAQGTNAAATQGATIKWTYIQTASMAAAMKQNQIDGMVAAPPYTTDTIYGKSGVLWLSGPDKTFPGGYDTEDYGDPLLASTKSFLDKHPDVVKAMVKSILDTGDFIKANPDQAGKILKAAAYPDMADAEFKEVWQATLPLLNQPRLTLESVKKTLELDHSDINAEDLYPGQLLDSVK